MAADLKNFYLEKRAEGWRLVDSRCAKPRYLEINLQKGSLGYRQKRLTQSKDPLKKILGIKFPPPPNTYLIDATAGLGKDAWLFAQLGLQVSAIERNELLYSLLAHALSQNTSQDFLKLYFGDSRHLIPQLAKTHHPAFIYLDPMFPPRLKSALVKKNMQMLEALVGEDPDAEELLEVSLKHATQRVIVKRPIYAPPLLKAPHFSNPGKTTRFDIYPTHTPHFTQIEV
ncbi:MAG: class I SAM-dependent methyltransferase [Deltaproteobacteria bacterium]|nr:class I SAM-dependent methyltransferase [Deltaproteobacteria bacterium]